MKHQSTKTYGTDRGFSCAFRQPKATHSHCSLIHGYSLGFKFTFEADYLDDKNWVYDFGNCKWIKKYLQKSVDSVLVLDPAWEVKPKKKKKAKKKKKKKKSSYDEPWNGIV